MSEATRSSDDITNDIQDRIADTVTTPDVAADTQDVVAQQHDAVTRSEVKVGYVYKDKRDIEVLIVRISPSVAKAEDQPSTPRGLLLWNPSRSSSSSQYPVSGVALGNCLQICSYTIDGKFSVADDDSWERNLLLETGKLWQETK